MVDQDNSPIQIIRRKEADAKEMILADKKNSIEKLNKLKEQLEENIEDYEKILKEKGNEKLKQAKIEATEFAKTEIAKSNKERKTIIDNSEAKKDEAIKLVIETFQTLIEK